MPRTDKNQVEISVGAPAGEDPAARSPVCA
jgi:hypothetical protein